MNTYTVTTINREEHVVEANGFVVSNGCVVFMTGTEPTHYFPGSVTVVKSDTK